MHDASWDIIVKGIVALAALATGAGGIKLFQAWRRWRRDDEETTIDHWRDAVRDLRNDRKKTLEKHVSRIEVLERKVEEGALRELEHLKTIMRLQIEVERCQKQLESRTT